MAWLLIAHCNILKIVSLPQDKLLKALRGFQHIVGFYLRRSLRNVSQGCGLHTESLIGTAEGLSNKSAFGEGGSHPIEKCGLSEPFV